MRLFTTQMRYSQDSEGETITSLKLNEEKSTGYFFKIEHGFLLL
ncbi:hypothetical protein M153_4870006057, partial [Pseudoloma neurophilia]